MLYAASASIAAGVWIGTIVSDALPGALLFFLAAAALSLYAFAKVPADIRRDFLIAPILLAAFAAGMLRIWSFPVPSRELDRHLGAKIIAEGIVIGEPDKREGYAQLPADIVSLHIGGSTTAVQARAIARIPLQPEFSYGDRIVIEGKLAAPEIFETETGRKFDYPAYLAKDGIGYVIQFASAELVSEGNGSALQLKLYSVKEAFVRNIRRIFPEPHSSLLIGILLGGKSGLGDDAERDFKNAGLSHIVVLSGYNIAIVSAAAMHAASRLPRRWRSVAAALAIIFFVLAAGAGASVVRAAIMSLLVILAGSFSRRYDAARSLSLAGILMVLHNPMILVHDPSFQLSFLATAGLVLASGPIEKYLRKLPAAFSLREIVSTTLATQIFVLPLLLHMIGDLSLVSLPANVLALPAVPAAMAAGFAASLAAFVPGVFASVIGFPAYAALSYILGIAHAASALPFASVSVPAFSAWLLVPWYAAYGWLLWKLKKKEKAAEKESDVGISAEAMEYELI